MAFPQRSPEPAGRRLVRSRQDRWVAGVAGGIGHRYGISPGLVRLLFVVSLLLPGPQILLYLILWIVLPKEPMPW
jgi:phage shock protein C